MLLVQCAQYAEHSKFKMVERDKNDLKVQCWSERLIVNSLIYRRNCRHVSLSLMISLRAAIC